MPLLCCKRGDRTQLRKTFFTFPVPRLLYTPRSLRKANHFIVAVKNEASKYGGAVNGLRTLESALE